MAKKKTPAAAKPAKAKTSAESPAPPAVRDLVKELRRVRAGDLLADPRNWRTHSDTQRKAVQGALSEIGIADALLAREDDQGQLVLIDGHLRADLDPELVVPVLIIDADEETAGKILATLDPLAALAGTDVGKLASLTDQIKFKTPELGNLLEQLRTASMPSAEGAAAGEGEVPEGRYKEQYGVIVMCEDEAAQEATFEALKTAGYECRIVVT